MDAAMPSRSPEGGELTVDLLAPCKRLRLALDPDFSRQSISSIERYQRFAMRTHVNGPEEEVHMPAHLLRSCAVAAVASDGREIASWQICENRRPRLYLDVPEGAAQIRLRSRCAAGAAKACAYFHATRRADRVALRNSAVQRGS